jgi:uncharacterized protein YfbU (UPF0304 family)
MAKKNTNTASVEISQVEKSFEEQMAELNAHFGIKEDKDRTLLEIFTDWKVSPVLERNQTKKALEWIKANFKDIEKITKQDQNLDNVFESLDFIEKFETFILDLYGIKTPQNLSMKELGNIINFLKPQIEKSFRA